MVRQRVSEALPAWRGFTSQALAEADADGARWLRHFVEVAAQQEAVATAQGPDGRLAAVRCSDVRVLSDAQLLVGWSMPAAGEAAAVFERATHFALTVMGSEGEEWLRSLSQAGQEKFARIAFEFGRGGAPLPECAVATLEGVMRQRERRGGHAMFIGRAVKVRSTTAPGPFQGEITDD